MSPLSGQRLTSSPYHQTCIQVEAFQHRNKIPDFAYSQSDGYEAFTEWYDVNACAESLLTSWAECDAEEASRSPVTDEVGARSIPP
ncbi:hypothetical protein IEO21_08937 [Rhodonia placenta]|uniref:Uncharacterized protein n=2 Tax=Rhodonia placenta TaxID=104341 RepID=A0A1X6N7W1_9APHY|nr:hypothetical protein POSPLADRAFT_1134608 [Postia placenta MAD-698-R-SB12]KAF9805701.1 hypothetical protein IEO21_08937 [Postia placenta]OSX64592.1 hypothetical protein POSPLADRAFT_1134608 [Postia placenta MAD-698-R-SB12]